MNQYQATRMVRQFVKILRTRMNESRYFSDQANIMLRPIGSNAREGVFTLGRRAWIGETIDALFHRSALLQARMESLEDPAGRSRSWNVAIEGSAAALGYSGSRTLRDHVTIVLSREDPQGLVRSFMRELGYAAHQPDWDIDETIRSAKGKHKQWFIEQMVRSQIRECGEAIISQYDGIYELQKAAETLECQLALDSGFSRSLDRACAALHMEYLLKGGDAILDGGFDSQELDDLRELYCIKLGRLFCEHEENGNRKHNTSRFHAIAEQSYAIQQMVVNGRRDVALSHSYMDGLDTRGRVGESVRPDNVVPLRNPKNDC